MAEGTPRSTPASLVEDDTGRYLVAPYGVGRLGRKRPVLERELGDVARHVDAVRTASALCRALAFEHHPQP
jgi:hypothetical protein